MKPLQLIFIILLATACNTPQKEQPLKTIDITYHPTIETIMIVRAIDTGDYFFRKIPLEKKGRPMLFRARQHFAAFATHPAVAETRRLLEQAGDIGGVLIQGTLYGKALPDTGLQQEPGDDYWKAHRAELTHYLTLLSDFYKQANVPAFLQQNKEFYDGAIAEARQHVADTIITAMEDYFGKQHTAYHMYLMPLCPYGWGFSGTTVGKDGRAVYAVISPVQNIKGADTITRYTTYGFSGDEAPSHYRELVVHEYVHAFITDVITQDSFKKQIAFYDTLYTPALDSAMGELGYAGWWSFVNEHLVRLGHIRVAALLDEKEANALRQVDKESGFIFMPQLEDLIKTYETNRTQYKTIDDFLPQLINHFRTYTTTTANTKLHPRH